MKQQMSPSIMPTTVQRSHILSLRCAVAKARDSKRFEEKKESPFVANMPFLVKLGTLGCLIVENVKWLQVSRFISTPQKETKIRFVST